jgi:hypothetical protein
MANEVKSGNRDREAIPGRRNVNEQPQVLKGQTDTQTDSKWRRFWMMDGNRLNLVGGVGKVR